jgi:hypothetical protein
MRDTTVSSETTPMFLRLFDTGGCFSAAARWLASP